MKPGLLSSAEASRGFGDGQNFLHEVLLLIWKQLPPITDTQSIPAQLLPQGSPKISSKDRGRSSPEALSKCKVSLFSSNLTGYFWFCSVSLKPGPGGCCVPNRSQSQGCTEGTGTSVIPVVAVRAWASRWATICPLDQLSSSGNSSISARLASTAQENEINLISQRVFAVTFLSHQCCCC